MAGRGTGPSRCRTGMRLIPRAQSGCLTRWHHVWTRGGIGVRVRNRRVRKTKRRSRGSVIHLGEEERWHRDTFCALAVSFRRSFEGLNWISPGTAVSARKHLRRETSPNRPTPFAKVPRPPPVRVVDDEPSSFVRFFASDRTAPCRPSQVGRPLNSWSPSGDRIPPVRVTLPNPLTR